MDRFWFVRGSNWVGFGVDLGRIWGRLGWIFSMFCDLFGGRAVIRRDVIQASQQFFPKRKCIQRRCLEGLRSSLHLSALPVLARKGLSWRSFFALGRSWAVLGRPWGGLVPSCAVLGWSWSGLGRSWAISGRSWSRLGGVLGRFGSVLGLKIVDDGKRF